MRWRYWSNRGSHRHRWADKSHSAHLKKGGVCSENKGNKRKSYTRGGKCFSQERIFHECAPFIRIDYIHYRIFLGECKEEIPDIPEEKGEQEEIFARLVGFVR